MRKIFVVILIANGLFLSSIAQKKIEIDENGLFINSVKITKATKPGYIQNLLGKPDRIFLKANTIWSYDKLGLCVYVYPDRDTLNSISIVFKKQDYEFSPKSVFSDEFIIYGNHVDRDTPAMSLKKIKDLSFRETNFQVYRATTTTLILIFEYLDDVNKLEAVGISFK